MSTRTVYLNDVQYRITSKGFVPMGERIQTKAPEQQAAAAIIAVKAEEKQADKDANETMALLAKIGVRLKTK